MKNIFSTIYRKYYVKLIPDSFEELRRQTKDCDSILDIGCGANSPIQYCNNKMYRIGVDAYMPSIKASKKKNLHDKYYLSDILSIDKKFKPKSVDCVLAFDLIEHLSKKDGLKLILMMEKIARKKVIIFTPNGFLKQGALYGNPWQVHKSGWSSKEMQKRGYAVTGINGWINLRGDLTLVKYKPRFFWDRISDITQIYTRYKPKYAFQIFCVKKLD